MSIPVIDIFAGPGGLGEGISSLYDHNNDRIFKIELSIEKDPFAHQTLQLRSFYRQFRNGQVPNEYYSFIKGEIAIEDLYEKYSKEAFLAKEEAWCGTLGEPDEKDKNGITNREVDDRIRKALGGEKNWLLIGGPPCQAYSLVGRSRRQEKILDEVKDKRVGLYKEYLRIIAVHTPAVFVMENVKGLLSAKTHNENNVFHRIIDDLSEPLQAYMSEEGDLVDRSQRQARYKIYSLVARPRSIDLLGNPEFDDRDFIIKAEEYGIPQKRHRVILLGIRDDINYMPEILEKKTAVNLASVIGRLPIIRSGITREFIKSDVVSSPEGEKKVRAYKKVDDNTEVWQEKIVDFNRELNQWFEEEMETVPESLPDSLGYEFQFVENYDLSLNHPLRSWYFDAQLQGVLHHVSRKHLIQDIKRYLFAAKYTQQYGTFPRMEDYKNAGNELLPDHENADSGKFVDRFRVQMPFVPATTITSHISKDGHYFIHYDPLQARSLTVREAARIQTFPDNYYFCGGRTQQFHQVGNAVPPYLAYQIAKIVAKIFVHIPIQRN